MLRKGVCVSIGTDGASSSNRMDMVDEMWLTSLIHKGWRLDSTVVPSTDILCMATKNGAKIVVCTLKGTKEIPKNMFRRHHDVYFDILAVVDTKDNSHTAELGEQIHAIMSENLKKD